MNLNDSTEVTVNNLDYLHLIVSQNYTTSPKITKRSYDYSLKEEYEEYAKIRKSLRGPGRCDVHESFNEKRALDGIVHSIQYNFLNLSEEDVKKLLEKPVELYMWTGHLWDELFDGILKANNKPEEMKRVLRIVQRLQYCQYFTFEELQDQMIRFFDLIVMFNVLEPYCLGIPYKHSDKVVDFLEVFSDVKELILEETISLAKLKVLVDCCQKENFRLFSQQGRRGYFSVLDVTEVYTFALPGFTYLLQSGVTFDFSLDAFKLFENRFSYRLLRSGWLHLAENIGRENYAHINYRLMQTFEFFNDNLLERPMHLQYFWLSIPDPFLIKEDFDGMISGFNDEALSRKVARVQAWYVEELKLPADRKRQPRSLKHITRCCVRRRLSECFQLPNILQLPIIKNLHSYLTWSDLEDMY